MSAGRSYGSRLRTGIKNGTLYPRLSTVGAVCNFPPGETGTKLENSFDRMLLASIVISSWNHWTIKPISIFQRQCCKKRWARERALATLRPMKIKSELLLVPRPYDDILSSRASVFRIRLAFISTSRISSSCSSFLLVSGRWP